MHRHGWGRWYLLPGGPVTTVDDLQRRSVLVPVGLVSGILVALGTAKGLRECEAESPDAGPRGGSIEAVVRWRSSLRSAGHYTCGIRPV